ncbi:MAG: hypothetical protein LAQ69_37110 [Acidobacteriia bacterium]|nr:hypothetical protein [Terriglobia bacterium]
MTVRENVHQLIDTLPEDRLADVLDYLADLQDEDASIGSEAKAVIQEGLDDIRSGRTISLSDYRRSRGCSSFGRPEKLERLWLSDSTRRGG